MIKPKVEKKDKILEMHGDQRIDPYFWLNDQSNKDVIRYLEQENTFLEDSLRHSEHFQKKIFEEMKGRIRESDDSSPMKDGKYWYFHKFIKGKQYPIYCRKVGSIDGPEEVILDQNELAEGKNFCDLGFVSNSPDHKFLAYAVDEDGDERYKVFIKDLNSGESYSIDLDNASTSFEWLSDSTSFLVTCLDDHLRPRFVYRGYRDSNEKPVQIFEEKDSGFFVWLDASEDEKYKFICLHGNNMSEVYFSQNIPEELSFKIICERKKDHEYNVSHLNEQFLILSNWKADNFALYTCGLSGGEPSTWSVWRDYNSKVLTESFSVFKDYVVLQEVEKALPRLRIIDRHTDEEYFIDYGGDPCEIDIVPPREFDSKVLRYVHSSMSSPLCTFDYYFESQTKELVKIQEIPDQSFDSNNYETERLYIKAGDGAEIPVSLVYRKGIKLDGSNPLYLYAYGSYGSSMDPSFSSSRFSYIDRGFVYAIAHVRGGMELGRQWYLDGKLLQKMNTFNDFISVAEGLIELGYTCKGNIVAKGGSAGGLLMGVVSNWRPDLFKAIIADVPFVDVLTTMLDDSLPLTTIEYNEWGNPNDPEYYNYIKQYSPYDNVAKQEYPAMLVICGLNDMRVTYWEPAKWVAKLREEKTDDNPLFLKTHMGAGHSGASGRYDHLKDLALEVAFIIESAYSPSKISEMQQDRLRS